MVTRLLYHKFAGLLYSNLIGCERPLRVTKSSSTFCSSSWCVFPMNHRGLFIMQFKDALFLMTGSSSPPTIPLLGHIQRIVQPTGTSSHSVLEVCRGHGTHCHSAWCPASRWFAHLTALFAFLVCAVLCMSRWSSLLWAFGHIV